MAHTVANPIQNPSARLRSRLDTLESAAIKPNATTVEALLLELDALEAEFANLEAQGVDLRAERVRWENLIGRLRGRPQLIANATAALPGGLAGLRARHAISGEQSADWWRADQVQGKRRRRLLVEIVAIAVGIPLLLGAIYWGVTTLFPPDAAAVATLEAEAAIDAATAAGDPAAALPAVEAALAAYPEELSLAVWVAILADLAGQRDRAVDAATDAEALAAGDLEVLWLLYSDHHARLDDAATSLDYAQRVIARNPVNAEGWYHQGRAAALLGDRQLALRSLERTSDLAADTSPALAVNARFLLADLMRQPPLPLDLGMTETLTVTLPVTPQP